MGVSNVANILEMLQSAVLTNTTEVDQTSSSMAIIESTLASIAGCSTVSACNFFLIRRCYKMIFLQCSSINTTEDVLAVLSSVSRWTASGLNPPTDIRYIDIFTGGNWFVVYAGGEQCSIIT